MTTRDPRAAYYVDPMIEVLRQGAGDSDPDPKGDRLDTLLRKADGGLDRQTAHELLDAALDHAAAATDADGRDAPLALMARALLAQAAGRALAEAVAGWAVPVQRSPEEWDKLARTDPERWRDDAATCMEFGRSVVPQPVSDALMSGLNALNRRAPPPAILTPAPEKKGYGRNQQIRHLMEQVLLVHIEIEKAKGRPALDVRFDVAELVGIKMRSIEVWAKDWRNRDGKEHVAQVFADAAAFGRGHAASTAVLQEIYLLRLYGLHTIAITRRVAR